MTAAKWPPSARNRGRLHSGTVAGFTSENLAGLNRNPQIGCTGPQPAQDASTSALLAQRPQGSTSYGLMKQGVGIGLAQLRCDAQELTLFLLGAGRGFC